MIISRFQIEEIVARAKKDREKERKTERQSERQRDRVRDRETERQRERQTKRKSVVCVATSEEYENVRIFNCVCVCVCVCKCTNVRMPCHGVKWV